MAVATNPRDVVRRITISDAAWTEIKATVPCYGVTIGQLGSETTAAFHMKHRSDDVGEAAEYVFGQPAVWKKGTERNWGAGHMRFAIDDTFGFFQRVAAGSLVLVVREHTI